SGAAEMRISVNTETLGPIELRATSEKDRIGAVIAAAKPETQELLNSELPTLHQALSERNLQVQQLTVSQGSLAGGMSGRGGYSQSPDAWQKQAAGNYWQPPSEATVSSTEDLPAAVVSMAVPGKLSVHA
ncbi:MAG TPA: flagellar hook-length control protein FliK, partial [Candidatus Baltobacteraceae bacterium]|nr:flagellar hook-length control protein FliK [Candidatus Baltobacteraceae bacterium]